MSCAFHPQWIHAAEECPHCAEQRFGNPTNIGIGRDGKKLPHSPAQVAAIMQVAMKRGTLIMAMFEIDGDLAVQVFGEPSERLCVALDSAAASYRKAVEASRKTN
jgi:hypothetical protein